MPVQLWGMHRSLLLEHNILILSISPSVNRLSGTCWSWNESTPHWTCLIIWLKHYHAHCFTDTRIISLDMSPQCTHLSTNLLLVYIRINIMTWKHLFLRLRHPWLLLSPEHTPWFMQITWGALGYWFFGMASPILYVLTYKIGGGVTIVCR